jgi:hypothetical protein
VLAVVATIGGCARTQPKGTAAANLYRDLQRLVGITAATGWEIDRVALRGIENNALRSVCRVPVDSRMELMQWLDDRIIALGGPVEEAWRKRGKKLSKVKHLLELTRIRMTLRHASEQADTDCPFWMEPDPNFRGLQIADDRWMLSFGGGGKLTVVGQDDHVDLNFGGAGRILFGRAIGSRVTLLAGLEAGASASFPRDEMGERGALVLGLDGVVPLVMRYRLVNSYFEVEAGPMGRFTEATDRMIPGVRVGLAIGARASRQRWFFPGAAFGVGFERTFPDSDQEPPRTVLKVGFRAAIDVSW